MNEAGAVLALDIGGTKMLAALVRGETVGDSLTLPTPKGQGGPAEWLEALFSRIAHWQGTYESVGVAVTGIVDDGLWSPLNRRTLDIPDRFPLLQTVVGLSGKPAIAANDAQAAAWGEYRICDEAGDLVFLTISTGIGGGVVLDGKLRTGLAGHFGLMQGQDFDGALEDHVSGNFIAASADAHEPGATAREVFEAAAKTESWAEAIVDLSARRAAILCCNIQLTFDPERIVIGGGIGLAPGYRARIEAHLDEMPERLRPRLVPARLGDKAGVVGIADLALRNTTQNQTKQ
ncbi:ROK family protein [uncultured Nitratireductor sp.]|uniref:ROK family protein n=1 Tax=uncultured Nitratireductor sp. TaxID=520953 RepID=UPI0025F0E2D1|nr:ROK family protein [uncultured Nitratireductor sp.]